MKFDVGGQEFAIPKESLAFADVGDGTWYGGVQSRGDMTFDILGDSFLKGIYAVSPFPKQDCYGRQTSNVCAIF